MRKQKTMPKVKSSLVKSSKLVSNRKIGFNRVQLLAILLILSLVGVVLVFKTFAAGGVIHGYFWNSPGIGHNGGYPSKVIIQDGTTREVWEEPYTILNGGTMWYGPYANFNGSGTS